MQTMYQKELGELYRPAMAARLYAAHALIERYFAADGSSPRSEIASQIEGMGLDPNLLGRITRLRVYWPVIPGGVYYVNEKVGPHPVYYFLGIPRDYDRTKAHPLVIKLANVHPFVTDPPPTQEQVARIYTDWINQELAAHPDAVVLMPLLNLDELYGPSYKGMNSVFQPLQHVVGRVNIDPARVYMLGQGMAAHATWNLSVHYPTYFAGIGSMAGGVISPYQILRVLNLRNTYCVVWHDAEDPVLKVDISRKIVQFLQKSKYDVDYEETKGLGHAPGDQIAERLYQKMRRRSRELYPREVALASNRPDSHFNRCDWVQVFQMLTPGPDQRVRFQHGSGTAMLYQNSYDLVATIREPNTIDVKTRNTESMRFYLNDQMVDFAKPVVIKINGPVRFNATVKPSTEEMLKDQMFLGRGWRYHTAFADVDFGAPTTRPATTRPSGRIIRE